MDHLVTYTIEAEAPDKHRNANIVRTMPNGEREHFGRLEIVSGFAQVISFVDFKLHLFI